MMKKLAKFLGSERGFDCVCWWAGGVMTSCTVLGLIVFSAMWPKTWVQGLRRSSRQASRRGTL